MTEEPGSRLAALLRQFPPRTSAKAVFGAFSYGSPALRTYGEAARLRVGKFCSIAQNVTVFLGGEHRADWVTTYPFTALMPSMAHIPGHPKSKGDVVVGNDVWIGDGATVLSGVRIGDGAVIGAGAMIAKDVPPYAIAGGNPGRVLRYRFAEHEIAELLRLRWWDWPLPGIEAALPLLLSGDLEALFRYAAEQGLQE